jgi:hypothetical protein
MAYFNVSIDMTSTETFSAEALAVYNGITAVHYKRYNATNT